MSWVATRRYRDRYPRFGKLAVLCEGDVAGFEVDMIEKWTAFEGYVDVWPCGTKTAIYGVSDAIGRSVPTIAIEDRDYRSIKEAGKECRAKAQDRSKRAVNLVDWLYWQRHEIENYLIEPAVMLPVLSAVFQQHENTVFDRLAEVVDCSRVDHVAQCLIARLRAQLPSPVASKYILGLPRDSARPKWNASKRKIESPPKETVLSVLQKKVEDVIDRFRNEAGAVCADSVREDFDRCYEDSRKGSVQSEKWRVDWAGKDILIRLLRWLAGEFGWPSSGGNQLERIQWEKLKSSDAAAREREMLEVLQPRLVQSFLVFLDGQDPKNEIRSEWSRLRDTIASAIEQPGRT